MLSTSKALLCVLLYCYDLDDLDHAMLDHLLKYTASSLKYICPSRNLKPLHYCTDTNEHLCTLYNNLFSVSQCFEEYKCLY